jgi:lipoyl(octanoyl) transferase
MDSASPGSCAPNTGHSLLQAHLLGSVEFDAVMRLQRRLVYQVTGDRSAAAVILCEHPRLITIGRQGSWAQIQGQPEELKPRNWPVRWVNRGGPCLLHMPGQIALYPILPLDCLSLSVQTYLDRLHAVLIALLNDFGIRGQHHSGEAGVWVGSRRIAGVGVAVRNWVSYFGATLNVNPDLAAFRLLRSSSNDQGKSTSIERERHGPLRPALVRERLLEHFAAQFQFDETALVFNHPSIQHKAASNALAPSS